MRFIHPDARNLLYSSLLLAATLASQDAPDSPLALPPSADLGNLCQGYTVQAAFGLDWPDEPTTEKPRVIAPSSIRVLECTSQQLAVQLDTTRLGRLDVTVTVHLGPHSLRIPIAATILPATPGTPSVALATGLITARSTDEVNHFAPFRRIAARSKMQAHHLVRPRDGRWFTPELLQTCRVVLIANSALVELHDDDRILLQGFACGGGRLIVSGSRFYAGTLPVANQLLSPFGMQMPDRESTTGVEFDLRDDELADEPLLEGVQALRMQRAGITELEHRDAFALASTGEYTLLGMRRLASGGEVVTLPVPLWWRWIDASPGNARLFRNLLSR